MITIREATVDDASAIAYVHICSWRETYTGLLPVQYLMNLSHEERATTWQEVLGSSSGAVVTYVAVNERGHVVGFASAGWKGTSRSSNRSGELYAVHFLTHYSQCGLGQRLVNAIVEHMLGLQITSMTAWVLVDDIARGYYEASGGVVVDHKTVKVAQRELCEVCYGWFDLYNFRSQTPQPTYDHFEVVYR